MTGRRTRTQRALGPRSLLALIALIALLAPTACGRADATARATPPRGASTAAAESVTVVLPPMSSIARGSPVWTRSLEDLSLPDGRLWSAYSPAGVVATAERVLVVDEANHELLALDSAGQVVTLAGGLGQGGGELYTPGDAALLGDQAVVADRANARLVAFSLADVSEASRLPLPGPSIRIAFARGTLYALTLVPRDGPRVLRIAGCCVSPAADTMTLTPPLRSAPRSMAALPDGRLVMLSAGGDASVYSADGSLTRVLHFADAPSLGSDSATSRGAGPAGRFPVAIAAPPSGAGLLVSLGDAVGCFDIDAGTFSGLWQPTLDERGRLATVSLVAPSDSAIYTYQPASHTLARYPRRC